MGYLDPPAGEAREALGSTQSGIDVRAYGATGDNATDDTAAIQAAIDAAGSEDTVFLPAGRYRISDPLTITSTGVRLQGAGYGVTFIVLTADVDGIQVNVGGESIVNNVSIGDLCIGSTANRTAGSAIEIGYAGFLTLENIRITHALGGGCYEGLRLGRVSDSHFRAVRIQACRSHGIVLAPDSDASVIVECNFDAMCEVKSCLGDGLLIQMDHTYTNGVCSVEGCHYTGMTFYNNTGAGVRIKPNHAAAVITGHHFRGECIIDSNGAGGLVCDTTGTDQPVAGAIRRLIVDQAWLSANTGPGISISSQARHFSVANGFIQRNTQEGILVDGATMGRIQNNTIYDNSLSEDGVAGGATGYYGIDLTGATTYVSLIGNRLYNSTESSVDQNHLRIGASCTNIMRVGNFIDDDSTVDEVNLSASATDVFAFDMVEGVPQFELGTANWRSLRFRGGATGSSVYLRINGSRLEWMNSAYTAVALSMINAGAICYAATPASGAATSLSNGSTIGVATSSATVVYRTTNGGAVTGIILAAGQVMGQQCIVHNEGTGSITFATAATSNVLDGLNVVINVNRGALFSWDSVSARWVMMQN